MPSYPGFVGPSYLSASYMADRERCVNRYPEQTESPTSAAAWALMPCPGFDLFAESDPAPGRGVFAVADEAYAVAGFSFVEVFADSTTTVRGTVEADDTPATLSANGQAGDQVFITSGGVAYVYDRTAHTLAVTGVPGTTATMGGSMDGRSFYLDAVTGTVYCSAQYDAATWDASLFAQSTAGDPWVSMAVTGDRLIHLMGQTTREIWSNQGAAGFPFTPIAEAYAPVGIAAPYGFAVDSGLTFLGQTTTGRPQIYRMNGYTPVVVSTSGIDQVIQGYETMADATAFAYQADGHSFTLFTFGAADATWVVDEKTGLWHERAYWDTVHAVYHAYRPCCVMSAFGKLLVADRLSGDIYEMTPTVYTDVDGSYIRRMRQPPRWSMDQQRFTVHSLQVVCDVGIGLNTGQGSDPQLTLRTSRDGGKTFGRERSASMGKIGAFGTRVKFDRCGQARNRVDQFVDSDPVPSRLVDCVAQVTVDGN
jgi:hypothetical protein